MIFCSEFPESPRVNWYYVSDHQQQGPVADAELDELIRAGTVGPTTLVWRQGLAEWQPLSAVRPSAAAPVPPVFSTPASGDSTAMCAECRQVFAQSDMVRLNQCWVCAGCKPVFLQRLAEGAAPAAVGVVWRAGKQMVMRPETPLADSCVVCNSPSHGYRLKRTLYWHTPYLYLLILISLLIYVIVALCVRKKAVIHIGLCEQHRAERKWFIAGGWLGVLLGLALLFAGIANGSGALALAGVALFIAAAIVGIVKGAVVSAAKIEDNLVWVKGAKRPFLANLPEWTVQR